MKKGKTYVVKGNLAPITSDTESSIERKLPPLPGWLQPSPEGGVLPYDYGMEGATGAHDVKPLARFLPQALKDLEATLGFQNEDPLILANRVLDQILPPAERHKLVPEYFADRTLTLSLANRGDRYRMNRSIVPKLKVALKPSIGFVNIRLIDR